MVERRYPLVDSTPLVISQTDSDSMNTNTMVYARTAMRFLNPFNTSERGATGYKLIERG